MAGRTGTKQELVAAGRVRKGATIRRGYERWGDERKSGKARRGGKEPVGTDARSRKAKIRLTRSGGSTSGRQVFISFGLGMVGEVESNNNQPMRDDD